jgi:DNA polymerase III sliding clamp (beta) subunit (PCNA family)
MLYNKNNLAVAKIASKENSGRPELTGVFFTKDKTCATDGFRLLEISVPQDKLAKDFTLGNCPIMLGTKPFIASAEMLKDKIKLKDNEVLAIKHLHDNRIEFVPTDTYTPPAIENVVPIRKIDATFPDYEKIFPKTSPIVEICVNAGYLAELLQVLGNLGGANKEVKIKFHGGDNPIVLEAGTLNQKGRGIIMPIKG